MYEYLGIGARSTPTRIRLVSPTVEHWREELDSLVRAGTGHDAEAWDNNRQWWGAFRDRSHVVINRGKGPADQGGRLYADDRLVDDSFFNGNTWEIGLKELETVATAKKVCLEIPPLRKDAPSICRRIAGRILAEKTRWPR